MASEYEKELAKSFFAEFPTMTKFHRNVRKNDIKLTAFDWLKQHCHSMKYCDDADELFHKFSKESLERKLYTWFLIHEADQLTISFSKNPRSNVILPHAESLSDSKNSHVKTTTNNCLPKIINITEQAQIRMIKDPKIKAAYLNKNLRHHERAVALTNKQWMELTTSEQKVLLQYERALLNSELEI